VANALQEAFAEILLERITSDRYPSSTHMDMFESLAPPRQRVQFVLYLLDRIARDANPSIPMMQRAQRLVIGFGSY
jgi:hypothetical protein